VRDRLGKAEGIAVRPRLLPEQRAHRRTRRQGLREPAAADAAGLRRALHVGAGFADRA
jgi:hypothetical protein